VAAGLRVISAVGPRDEELAREPGATPVRYGDGLAGRVRELGHVDAVFDAAGKGAWPTPSRWPASRPGDRPIRPGSVGGLGSAPSPGRAPGALADNMELPAQGRLRLRAQRTVPMPEAAAAHRLLESGAVREKIILIL
jgi:hypothetical protein